MPADGVAFDIDLEPDVQAQGMQMVARPTRIRRLLFGGRVCIAKSLSNARAQSPRLLSKPAAQLNTDSDMSNHARTALHLAVSLLALLLILSPEARPVGRFVLMPL